MPPKKGAKKGPRAYKLPDPIPAGEVLTDLHKKQWKLGDAIGQGGFGMLYLASSNITGRVGSDAEYVVKIEPHENGPLFVEIHFYHRAAKADKVDEWRKKQKLSHLGVPKYIGSGNHEHGKTRYRFMVMQRFGEDLYKKFQANNKRFSVKTAFTLGLQIVDALEYLHSNEYVHADIKTSNVLLGYGSGKAQQQAYLVDYGLAHRYMPDGKHKEYKEDPRKAHDGTAEFTSRDAHKGVCPSRRGDLEILGYNIIEWLTGSLPWYDKIGDCNYVMQQKISCMNNISTFINRCFSKGECPAELKQYLEYVQKLDYTDKPDYNKVRTLFKKAIVNAGFKDDGKLEFAAESSKKPRSPRKSPTRKRTRSPRKSPTRKRKAESNHDANGPATTPKKQKGRAKAALGSPMTPQQKKILEKMNAANSTDSPKKKAPAKSPNARRGAAAKSSTVGTKAKKTTKVKRKKRSPVDSSSTATQTTPGLKRNATKTK